jgi:hypothetical protein
MKLRDVDLEKWSKIITEVHVFKSFGLKAPFDKPILGFTGQDI